MSGVIWTSVLMVVLTIVFLVVLSSFASRVLGVRIGLGRLLLAGALGLGLEVGFESRFVWGQEDSTLALLPLQIGIIFLVSIATLVIAELLVPTGSIPRPDQWLPSLKARVARTRRYTEISRIAFRSGLIPFRPNSDRTAHGRCWLHGCRTSRLTFSRLRSYWLTCDYCTAYGRIRGWGHAAALELCRLNC